MKIDYVDMNKEIADTIVDLQEEKAEIERKISFVQSFNFNLPVDEDDWHKLCETSLRYSPVLDELVKNTFPSAINIVRNANYVNFELHGFRIQIPTGRIHGINIATDWYSDMKSRESYCYFVYSKHSQYMLSMRKYFDAVDNHLGWKAKAKARCDIADKHNIVWLFFWWFGRHKWKHIDRAYFEKKWNEEIINYENREKKIVEESVKIQKRLKSVKETLLPELNRFSDKHGKYNGTNGGSFSIDEILKKEGMLN